MVNRMVGEALITRLGHSVEFVENGELAIERLRLERYDLVLMDNRMPVIDGLQASRLIRSGTSGVLDPEIYICAATANVSEADRVKCREAGMDDYIKKPITERELTRAFGRALAHLSGRGMSPVNAAVPVVEPSVPQGLSEAELLATLDEEPVAASVEDPHGFSPETRQHLQELFWQHAPQRMATLRETFDSGDLSAMGDCAHALKSAAYYVGATELSTLCAELERLAADGFSGPLIKPLRAAEAEYGRLRSGTANSVLTTSA